MQIHPHLPPFEAPAPSTPNITCKKWIIMRLQWLKSCWLLYTRFKIMAVLSYYYYYMIKLGLKIKSLKGFMIRKLSLILNAQIWWLRAGFHPIFCRAHVHVCSQLPRHYFPYQLFLTWSKSWLNLSLQYSCCRVLRVEIWGIWLCPPQLLQAWPCSKTDTKSEGRLKWLVKDHHR